MIKDLIDNLLTKTDYFKMLIEWETSLKVTYKDIDQIDGLLYDKFLSECEN